MKSQFVVAIGLALGPLLLGRPRRVSARAADIGVEPLTIVIPARNEAANIGNLLEDLACSRPASSRVIVVDDNSTDATVGLAAAHPFVEVVDSGPLPEGWTGKSWACHQGAVMACGGNVAFIDADVRLQPGALVSVISELRHGGGLVSVQPHHEVGRPVENLSALFNVVAAVGARLGGRRSPAAFGPVMVSSVSDYRRVGGHSEVRAEVVEDVALGAAYRRSGLPVHSLAGGSAITFRMYPGGVRQLLEGWSKNIATGAARTPLPRIAAVVLWVAALGSVSLGLFGMGPYGYGALGPWTLAWYLSGVTAFRVSAARVGSFGWASALLLPVHVLCFVSVFARSAWCTVVRGSVTWRGRDIAVRRRRVRAG